MDHLRQLEEALLSGNVRSNHNRLNILIHESFIEIGYSGKTYTKAEILSALTNETDANYTCWSQDYEYISLTPDLVLIHYKEARMNEKGQLSRYAKRTSIWFNTGENWQLKFHQATPTEHFNKSSN